MSRDLVEVSLSSRIPNASSTWDAAHALGRAVLARHSDVETCTVWVHANRRAGLRWRLGRSAYLSLHWALTPHVDGVLEILGGNREVWDQLQVVLPSPTAPALDAYGRVHDLRAMLAAERALLPDPVGEVGITWGRYAGRPPRRVLRLGSCEPGDPPMIRIHPVLDHESVPDWFVGFLVFHELLHVVFPPEGGARRRIVHPPALRRAEGAHPAYARSIDWERRNLHALLQRCTRPREAGLMRLDRLVAHRTGLSRKDAVSRVRRGRVSVDGARSTDPAADVAEDAALEVDGDRLVAPPRLALFHKPLGVQSAVRDSHGRPCLGTAAAELLALGLHPVGRLDADTDGLLLFSAQGALTQHLLHPRRGIERVYVAIVDPPPTEALADRLAAGVDTADGRYTATLRGIEADRVTLAVTEGKHRMVRRMLANAGHPVLGLRRVAYGPFALGDLAVGAWREPTEAEWAGLEPSA